MLPYRLTTLIDGESLNKPATRCCKKSIKSSHFFRHVAGVGGLGINALSRKTVIGQQMSEIFSDNVTFYQPCRQQRDARAVKGKGSVELGG